MSKILIAFDDTWTSKTIKRYVIQMGHIVIDEAQPGNLAVDSYQNHNPDCVLLDMSNPFISSRTIKQICNTDPKAKIIIAPPKNGEWIIPKAIVLGAKDFFLLPINKILLSRTIDRVVFRLGMLKV